MHLILVPIDVDKSLPIGHVALSWFRNSVQTCEGAMRALPKHPFRASLLVILALLMVTGTTFAGSIHITGSTTWVIGSLDVSGSVVGLNSISSGYIRFVGYGSCLSSTGAYLTPSDPDQLDNDPNTADNYPEVSLPLTGASNKLDFNLTLEDPPAGYDVNHTSVPCQPGTWTWTGATLQVVENFGAAPGRLLDQQNYVCFNRGNGRFTCK